MILPQKLQNKWVRKHSFFYANFIFNAITHNENFEMIKPAIISLLKKYKNLELHLAGHLDIPKDIACFGNVKVFNG